MDKKLGVVSIVILMFFQVLSGWFGNFLKLPIIKVVYMCMSRFFSAIYYAMYIWTLGFFSFDLNPFFQFLYLVLSIIL